MYRSSIFPCTGCICKKSTKHQHRWRGVHSKVESFTHKRVYDVILSKKFLSAEDNVLIIDDFLANGCALQGLIELVEESGATIEGAGIVIEKGMQSGGQIIREKGIHLESLAIIDSMTDTSLTFKE